MGLESPSVSLTLFVFSAAVALLATHLLRPSKVKDITLTVPDEPGRRDGGSSTEELVRRWCVTLEQGFQPSWWLPNGHAQTIYSAMADFSKDDMIVYERKLLRLPDGGTIGIDLYPPLCVSLDAQAPLVVINHGLTGGSHESYVRNIAVWLAKPPNEGGLCARAAVVNFRGCASTPITSPHLYSSGATLELETAVHYLATLFPSAPMVGVGFSLGAAVMTRYLGEQGEKCRLRGAVVLCAPLELREMSARLDARQLFPKLYSFTMARKMLRSFAPHLMPDSPLSSPSSLLHPHLPAVIELTQRYKWTLRVSHVMELIVIKVGGSSAHFPFDGLQNFLEWACPGGWLVRIKRPTLAISALDDPIVCGECLPHQAIRDSSHVVLALAPHGGHLGWFNGPFRGPDRHRRWHVQPTIEFLRGVLNETTPEDFYKGSARVVKDSATGWCWATDRVGWKVVSADSVEESRG